MLYDHYKDSPLYHKIEQLLDMYIDKENGLMVDIFVDQGKNPERLKNNHKALFTAAKQGFALTVRCIMDQGIDNVNMTDDKNLTLLHCAVQSRKPDILFYLLKQGVNPNIPDSSGNTPLHWAVRKKNDGAVVPLLTNRADINCQNNQGKTPLYCAIEEHNDDIALYLIKAGADINLSDNQGHTPLHAAITRGCTKTVDMLLKNKADINQPDKNGITPLMHVFQNFNRSQADNRIKLVRLLLQNGADIHAVDGNRFTALQWAVNNAYTRSAVLLDKAGGVIHCPDLNHFKHALYVNEPALLRLMLKNGFNVNEQDTNGDTALHFAVDADSVHLIPDLLWNGANPDIKNNAGYTPLEYAIAIDSGSGERYINEVLKNPLYQKRKIADGMRRAVRTIAGFSCFQREIGR